MSQDIAKLFLCDPAELPIDSTPVMYSFRVLEYVRRAPPANITAWACRNADVKCVNAIRPLQIVQEAGSVTFELPRGFQGFFEVRSDAMPTLSYVTKPIEVDTVDRDLELYSPETFMSLAMLDGAAPDASTGVVMLEAFDCTGTPVGGVHFDSSLSGVRPFYIINRVPNHDVALTSLDAVANVAEGGFWDVVPGSAFFTARYGVGGPVLGVFNVVVRMGTLTFVDMYF